MQNRRDFPRAATFAAIGSGLSLQDVFVGEKSPAPFTINKLDLGVKLKLRFFPYEPKLKYVFAVATYSQATTPDVQIEIEYDGVTGYGEASMPPHLGQTIDSMVAFLKKVDLEQFDSPFRLEDILAYVDGITPGDTAAKVAIDIALHDLVSKPLGAPQYRIWGLDKAKAPPTAFTIGIDTPEVVREKTLKVTGQFSILKVKLGRENDKQMIEAIRSVSDLPIAAGANQGWADKKYALSMIQRLKEKGIVMTGQSMPEAQLDNIAWVTQHSPLPAFADESLQRLTDVVGLKEAFTGVNIKLMKYTGIWETRKMVTLTRALGMEAMVDCMMEISCAVSAAIQFSSAVDFADLNGNLLIANGCFKGMEVVKDKITLNDLPGVDVVKL